ncbi:MAG: cyclopropane-fatty-acyl-phospholipid synthase family protein [Phycisphaerales bacterium]
MSRVALPRSIGTARRERPTLRDRVARAALHRRLDSFRSGAIEIADPIGTATVGGAGAGAVSVHIHDSLVYRLAMFNGPLGLAEGYINGMWDCDDLGSLMRLFVREIETAHGMHRGVARLGSFIAAIAASARRNTRLGSQRNIAEHYDLGNDFFELMLDDTMTYSSGVYPVEASTLREAQVEKLDRICRKLELKSGDRVLETGSGWGSFSMHAAREYGCRVTTTTISKRQHEYAAARISQENLGDRIEPLLKDYRDLTGTYDALVSIEMIEAVGHAYLGTYFDTCAKLLAPDGRMLLQAISMPDAQYEGYRRRVDFIQRYVFPGSCCPSLGAINAAATNAGFKMSHLEDITPHYARTLDDWRARFEGSLDRVRELGYSERFIRMWTYYLHYCAAGFDERYISTSQIMLDRPGFRGPSIPTTVRA